MQGNVTTPPRALAQGMKGRKFRSPVAVPVPGSAANVAEQFEVGGERKREQACVTFANRRHDVAFAAMEDSNDSPGVVACEVHIRVRTGARRECQERVAAVCLGKTGNGAGMNRDLVAPGDPHASRPAGFHCRTREQDGVEHARRLLLHEDVDAGATGLLRTCITAPRAAGCTTKATPSTTGA